MTERRAISVQGVVQGVGFRPFVVGLAGHWSLTGFVLNRSGAVFIEVEGEAPSLDGFLADLCAKAPPLARIESLAWQPLSPTGEPQFRIEASQTNRHEQVFVSPDVATCDHCLDELFDRDDRRFGYPFLNCTNCGPRLTIITAAPYDRANTTMADFAMCPLCRAEYEDASNRRFHAQPTCCADCGPKLRLIDAAGKTIGADDPIAAFARALLSGRIGALKGLGGYHLACDARASAAVAELRRRKQRDEKPFALMAASAAAAASLCFVDAKERQLLCSPSRPIVLLRKRNPCRIAHEVAFDNPCLGIVLPYTPIHHLLMQTLGDVPLVMTSGNRSDEPIAIDDAEAVTRLGGIADLLLVHNRRIAVRCDDSVTSVVAGAGIFVRRSRGFAPEPIAIPFQCNAPILAVGGQQKGTFALGRDRHAFVSHHLGDLDYYAAYEAFAKDLALFEKLFAITPQAIVHDLHPDYASTRYACARSEKDGIKRFAVQHHHAHMASCIAEHGLTEEVIGVSFDGTGYGTDGAIWGGEFLVGDCRSFRRAAHLRYVGMPGGEKAIREPWRMALVHLLDAGHTDELLRTRISAHSIRTVRQMLELGVQVPQTSSIGRLFDAAACLAGMRDRVAYEGQAAIEFEWRAAQSDSAAPYSWEIAESSAMLLIDTRPIIRGIVADVARQVALESIARRFHRTISELIVGTCQRIRESTSLNAVVLGGGVFMNALLTHDATLRLTQAGFRVYRNHRVPPNDGGLSLGQLAVAAAQHS